MPQLPPLMLLTVTSLMCSYTHAMTKESSWSNDNLYIQAASDMHTSVLSDGSYVFAQNFNGYTPGLVVTDAAGTVINYIQANIDQASTTGFDIDKDGNYLLAGGIRSSLDGDTSTYRQAYITKIDPELTILDEVAYSLTPQELLAEASFYAIESDSIGNYYGLYFEYAGAKSVHVVKFDNALTPQTSVNLSLSDATWGDITVLGDGNVLVAYSNTLQILDPELNVLVSQTYPEYRFKDVTVSEQGLFVTASIGVPVTHEQSIGLYDSSTLQVLDEHILTPSGLSLETLDMMNTVLLGEHLYLATTGRDVQGDSDIHIYEFENTNLAAGPLSELEIGGSGFDNAGPIMLDNTQTLISTSSTRSADGDFPEEDVILGDRLATTVIQVE